MAAERRFRAMGRDAHVVVVGGRAGLINVACQRVRDLEAKWSRFLGGSEVTAINDHSGAFVVVSSDTVELVSRSLDGYLLTDGWFDPTTLGALVRAGYDRTFDEVRADPRPGASRWRSGAEGVLITENAVCLPDDVAFDPGGIGKGLAADIVCDELRAAGAVGACVNLGGDVRAFGASPRGDDWTIAIDHPDLGTLARVALREGAVATSTTLCRRWSINGAEQHHLIDPTTGAPSHTDVTFASVTTGRAWAAEVIAKALLLRPSDHPLRNVPDHADALFVDRIDRVSCTAGFASFVERRAVAGSDPTLEVAS
jgi:thiamine biosynthesis lipoprotein